MNLNCELIKKITIKYLDLKGDSSFHKAILLFFHKYDIPMSEETYEGIIRNKNKILANRRKLIKQFPFLKEFNKN